MYGNGITELGVPRLIESTSMLYKTLDDHLAGGVYLDTPKELRDEVAVWMNLLERINQVQTPGNGLENKLHGGQILCSKYATTLFDINLHLEISQTSMDPEKSSWARDELAVPIHSDGNAVQETYLHHQPLDLHIGAILRDAPRYQPRDFWEDTEPTFQYGSHDQQTRDRVQGVTEQQPRDTTSTAKDVHQLAGTFQQQSLHAQMMEKVKSIATGMEEMGLHLHNLNKPDIPAKESTQCRELLTTLFDQTKEDFWVFLQDFHDLGSQIANENDKTENLGNTPTKNKLETFDNSTQTERNDFEVNESFDTSKNAYEEQQLYRTRDSRTDSRTVGAAFPGNPQNGTQTPVTASTLETFLKALPETFSPSHTVSDRESEALVLSLELGVMEVEGHDWVSRFCDAHRYLNGILMAITVPKDLFMWHTQHFPVDSDTWTKGALVRTMSIVTESPRYLHSYPLRHGRSLPSGKPSLLLHWNLEDIREPHASARFKELVQVGGELQKRIGAFSYKQMVVCITIPWWICYKDTSGERKQAMEFLERMGIVGAIPVNEKSEDGVRKTLWCPSRIKVGASYQSVHAFLQETTFAGSPELEPAIPATPTRFVVVTVRKGHVHDWVDSVQCALGMDSKSLRYSVPTEEAISFSQLNRFYRNGGNPDPEPSKKV
ncbi:hypothetical protein G7Z17_g1958 [Cylindrodendrum hubeiense]|uniref:Uncharacterized protein n=1 Tax=Cylindrodendrum hubeiense TaxID=595255 RepID=A0A9P5LEW8_9HYPO|nr:hypothetical protein G7Z17_g1958 [Cylindrodendrum hubeiense]